MILASALFLLCSYAAYGSENNNLGNLPSVSPNAQA